MRPLSVICLTAATLLWSAALSAESVTKLYVPSGDGPRVIVYSLENDVVINELQLSGVLSTAAHNADRTQVWLFAADTRTCHVIDVLTDAVITSFDVGVRVRAVDFARDGRFAFVVGPSRQSPNDQVWVIDCNSFETLYPLRTNFSVGDVATSADSRSLFVSAVDRSEVVEYAIPSFEERRRFFVGPEPLDLTLTPDGSRLVVGCRGLDSGKRGGGQLVLVDPATTAPEFIFNEIGNGISGIAFGESGTTLVITYERPLSRPAANIRRFAIRTEVERESLAAEENFLLGRAPRGGILLENRQRWIGADSDAGLLMIDLAEDLPIELPVPLRALKPLQVAAVSVDVSSEIAKLEQEISGLADSAAVTVLLLKLAYLHRTASDKNSEVATYNQITGRFPNTFAAITANLQLSDIAFGDKLYSQSAEFAFNALKTYHSYLAGTSGTQMPSSAAALTALRRLALFDEQFKKNYTEELAKLYTRLSARNALMAQMFFEMGFYLTRLGDRRLAKRCFDEVQNQLASVDEPTLLRNLTAQLALATGSPTVLYKLRKLDKELTVDGDLSDWGKAQPLQVSGVGGYHYGTAPWGGDADVSGALYFGTSKTHLYIGGVVTDDTLIAFRPQVSDQVRLFFDFRENSGSYFSRADDCDNGCFVFTVEAPVPERPVPRLSSSFQIPYEVAGRMHDTGYSFEISLPLDGFGGWLKQRPPRFGLGIELIDYDDPTDERIVKAVGFLLPTDMPAGTPRPMLFGVGEF